MRRASLSLACVFKQLVSFARFSSSIARSLSAVSSASASAFSKYEILRGLGACFASISCSIKSLQLATVCSPNV